MGLGLILVAAVALGAIVALVVWRERVVAFTGRTVAYIREVRAEVRKVSWPTWEDLRKSTTVIIIFVLVIGLAIGLIDLLLSKILIDWLGRALG